MACAKSQDGEQHLPSGLEVLRLSLGVDDSGRDEGADEVENREVRDGANAK
jgi:hypothetical protein